MIPIDKLGERWISENWSRNKLSVNEDVSMFEQKMGIVLPEDLKYYFRTLNGSIGEYDSSFFQFYSLAEFNRFEKVYEDWWGIPNYRELTGVLKDVDKYFVIADYSIHLISYVIKLDLSAIESNDVLVVCGADYRKIADSFSEFIALYLEGSNKLYFNE